jgi:tetratricopeptide (TPR) repeat protein
MTGRKPTLLCITVIIAAVFFGVTWPPLPLVGFPQASEGPQPILERAQQLISQGQLEQARQELEQGRQKFPSEPLFFNFLGVIDAQENHPAQAEDEFRETIQRAPRYAGAYLNLGRLYQEQGAHDAKGFTAKAAEVYRALLQFDPQNIEANYQYALLRLRQHAFQDSLLHILRLPADDQQQPAALAIRCVDRAQAGDSRQASADADQLLKSPALTEPDVLSVLPGLDAAHDSLAIQILEGLRRRGLASASSLEQLGVRYWHAGRLQEARATLEESAQEQPGKADPLVELARVAESQQDLRGALGYLAHARELEPQNAAVQFFFGMVCVELDLHQDAYTSLKKAVELNPDNAYYNYALGAVCSGRENPREAVPYFEKYRNLKPEDPRGTLALGATYYYSHDLEAARAELVKIAGKSATAAGANYFLGRIADDMGEWPLAVTLLNRAIQSQPGYADAYAVLGGVYLNQKDFPQSGRALEQAINLDPDNYLANLNLTKLYGRTRDPRSEAQSKRFGELKQERDERAKLFLRTVQVAP